MHKAGAYFEIQNIDGGGTGGNATLRLAFANGNAQAKTEVFLNGVSIGVKTLRTTGNWATFKMMDYPISGLKPGNTNTLRFVGGQEGYNADFVQIIY
jgi:type VI protein secretion system component VasK